LHRGSVENGILTCHWHHARFDLATGGTFDPWADDVPTAPVEVRDGVVWIGARAGYADGAAHWHNRLREGLEQNIPLILAKQCSASVPTGCRTWKSCARRRFSARSRATTGVAD
jgi:hypothetical protein